MTSSPFITSAALHTVIIALLWCCANASQPKLPLAPQLSVELATLPELKAAATAPGSVSQAREVDPEEAADEEDVATAEGAASAQPLPPPVLPPAAVIAAQPVIGQPAAVAGSEISQAFARAAYVQQGMYRSRSYAEVATLAVRKMLEGKVAAREFAHSAGTAKVEANYGVEAGSSFVVHTDDGGLQQLLEDKQAWSLVPAPGKYRLNYRKVTFLVSLNDGVVRVSLSPQ